MRRPETFEFEVPTDVGVITVVAPVALTPDRARRAASKIERILSLMGTEAPCEWNDGHGVVCGKDAEHPIDGRWFCDEHEPMVQEQIKQLESLT